ncbi:hypothetical protein GCM10023084_04390 [Streptomyces lacrimifluminis]|uniref:Lipoprotein n=1 Tax=Streptomyces lacrimifluminis TaxID=1500077 RepID=A0A917NR58_9ACTN|nr:hypothetical protein [Streptomyces lacrimifluminis]GGJ21984.1 hypothetical protein GCM10012282_18130 [Streptomyces lacrimifluminis]
MHTNTTRTTTRLALVLTTALFAAGCGSEKAGGIGITHPRDQDTLSPSAVRAKQVADAWDGSEAAEAWRKGYFPMGEASQPPGGGFHSEDDKTAYTTQSYVLRGELPTTAPEEGTAKWEGGGSLTRPLMDARQAYTALDHFESSDVPHLTVTEATLGEMTIATSRGPATVPAWLFTLDGYDEPLKRVALRPSKLPKSPIGEAGESPTELTQISQLVEVSGDGRTVTVLADHGACEDGPRVKAWETNGSVVLSATVAHVEQDLPCIASMASKKVAVELEQPLGDRVLLNAFMGRPVPYGEWEWGSPSWS